MVGRFPAGFSLRFCDYKGSLAPIRDTRWRSLCARLMLRPRHCFAYQLGYDGAFILALNGRVETAGVV